MTPVLRLVNVSRRFSGLVAVSDVSLEILPGKLYSIIGPNGAGKSTLLNMLCGTLKPSSGELRYMDHDISRMSRYELARQGIARKFQVPSVFFALTVRQNLQVAQAGGLNNPLIDQTLADIGLNDRSEVLAGELAHGEKQWLELGMALVRQPRLLLLDEPTAGMSSVETEATAKLLLSLSDRMSVIVIEHDMSFVRLLNAETIVMHQGRLIASGSFEDIEANELVRDVYLGRR